LGAKAVADGEAIRQGVGAGEKRVGAAFDLLVEWQIDGQAGQ
jgi:hypothetical protein